MFISRLEKKYKFIFPVTCTAPKKNANARTTISPTSKMIGAVVDASLYLGLVAAAYSQRHRFVDAEAYSRHWPPSRGSDSTLEPAARSAWFRGGGSPVPLHRNWAVLRLVALAFVAGTMLNNGLAERGWRGSAVGGNGTVTSAGSWIVEAAMGAVIAGGASCVYFLPILIYVATERPNTFWERLGVSKDDQVRGKCVRSCTARLFVFMDPPVSISCPVLYPVTPPPLFIPPAHQSEVRISRLCLGSGLAFLACTGAMTSSNLNAVLANTYVPRVFISMVGVAWWVPAGLLVYSPLAALVPALDLGPAGRPATESHRAARHDDEDDDGDIDLLVSSGDEAGPKRE